MSLKRAKANKKTFELLKQINIIKEYKFDPDNPYGAYTRLTEDFIDRISDSLLSEKLMLKSLLMTDIPKVSKEIKKEIEKGTPEDMVMSHVVGQIIAVDILVPKVGKDNMDKELLSVTSSLIATVLQKIRKSKKKSIKDDPNAVHVKIE